MKTNFILISLLFFSFVAKVQAGSSTEAWEVTNIAAINTEYHDGWSTVTEDGLSLYFASNRPGGFVQYNPEDGWARASDGTSTRYDIYVSHRESVDSDWGKPILLPEPLNSEYNDHSAAESPDGHYLFFASSRPGGCGAMDLYVSYREDVSDDSAWQAPKNMGCQEEGGINGRAIDACPIYYSEEEGGPVKIYFASSATPNPATLDFKVGTFDPENLTGSNVETINISTENFDGHIDPYFGYLWGMYPDGMGGSDIWISDRSEEAAEWKQPVNLGSAVNTEYEEQMPSPSADGKNLYFPSNRPGGKGGMDVYMASKD